MFGYEWLSLILLDCYYESRAAKKQKSLQKTILKDPSKLVEYLKKYVVMAKIDKTDIRILKDLL